MKVLSFGATGAQGGPVAHQLLAKGHQVRVLLRNPERAGGLQQAGAEVVRGDLADPATLPAAFDGVDAVFLLIPFSSGGNPVTLFGHALQAARAAGVKFLVFNISGKTPKAPTGLPMLDYRIALEGQLRESGLPSVVLRPTAYMENLLGPWTLPGIVERDVVAYPVAPTRRVSWVAAADVAACAVAALERPQLAGSVFNIGGPEGLDGARIADSFSAALGRPIRYEGITPAAFGQVMAQIMGPEAGEATTRAYQASEAAPPDEMVIDMQPVLAQLPVQLTSLQTWVSQHADAFQRRERAQS